MKDFDLLQNISMTTNGSHVSREINGQPELWESTYNAVFEKRDEINFFLDEVFKVKDLKIILSGAGSSAFIGESLRHSFYHNTGIPTFAIPTTDVITHPQDFFNKPDPILIVSFARSGDSPESSATIELAEKMLDKFYHLVITCNAEGSLAKKASKARNSYVFVLPEESNDQALAMTGSFTSMALAALLISDIKDISNNETKNQQLIKYGELILRDFSRELKKVSELDFKRVVFLGAGALKGAAKESHLKLLEMTNGQIICQYNSFLGFRHGPRAVIDRSTLLVYLFSSDPYVNQYEIDLVKSIYQTENYLFSIGVGQCLHKLSDLNIDLAIDLCSEDIIPDDYFSVCSVLPSQIIGFYKSLALGLSPDSPSQNGGINRIVQGVTIYPY